MYDATTAIGQFLEAAAAKQPTPGGGSVTALVGALSASMAEMVVNYSAGKKGLEPHRDEFDIVFDNTSYVPKDVEPLVELFRGRIQQYVFTSSVAVYRRSFVSIGNIESIPLLHGGVGFPRRHLNDARR